MTAKNTAEKIPPKDMVAIENFLSASLAERGLSANSIDAYRNDLVYFASFLSKKNILLQEITSNTIRSYLEEMHTRQFSRASFLRKISSLNGFFSFLISEKTIKTNPMLNIKRPKKEIRSTRQLTPEQIQLLIDFAKESNDAKDMRNNCIISLMFSTGLRVSELASLEYGAIVAAISCGEKMLKVIGKGKKERLVPLGSLACEYLNKYLSVRDKFLSKGKKNNFLFCSNGSSGHITREQIGLLLKKRATVCGLDPQSIHPHAIRHSFATLLANKKINLRFLQDLLGHSDISTTQLYISILERDIVDFTQKNHPLQKMSEMAFDAE